MPSPPPGKNPEFDIYYESTQNTIPTIFKDININPYGRKLIETCVSHNLDYFISDDCLIPNVVSVKIPAPQFRSSCSMLRLTLKVDPITIGEHLLKDLPIRYKWNNSSKDLYKIALAITFSSHEKTILNSRLDTGDIDWAVDQVSECCQQMPN